MIEKINNTIQNPIPSVDKNNNERIEIRNEIATENDWDDFKKIKIEAFSKEPKAFWVTEKDLEKEKKKTEEEWRAELNNENSFTLLSRNADTPIGIARATFKIGEDDKYLWQIFHVYVNENFRRTGLSKNILNLVLDEIKKRGGSNVVRLNVSDTQIPAQKLYKKLGFEVYKKFESKNIGGIEIPGGKWMKKEI